MFTMSMGRVLKLAVLGAVVASAPAGWAAEKSGDKKAPKMPTSYSVMMKMKPMDIFHMMDTDKKGYVTKEEFMKFQEQLFGVMDKNKDGQVSAPEFTDRG
jgi:hypothetical protein